MRTVDLERVASVGPNLLIRAWDYWIDRHAGTIRLPLGGDHGPDATPAHLLEYLRGLGVPSVALDVMELIGREYGYEFPERILTFGGPVPGPDDKETKT